MTTSIKHFGENDAQSMNYRYDQLHRIAAAEAKNWDGNSWTHTQGKYRASYKYDRNGNIDNLKRYNGTAQLIDNLDYTYYDVLSAPSIANRPKTDMQNRLWTVNDPTAGTEGLGQGTYTYEYDKIGNLTKNAQDGIENIKWNIYGKVEKVTKMPDQFGVRTIITYKYDGTGNRIMKKVNKGATTLINYYLRDASGNVMAIYEDEKLKEIPIYGSSRLGQYRPKTDAKKTALSQRIYEFSNHLGNVLVTLTDNKVPLSDGTYKAIVLSASDYYPFGMAMKERSYSNSEYRYGFNGKENDTDFGEGKTDFGARIYDGIIGRWFACDALESKYPSISTYAFVANSPLMFVDTDGREIIPVKLNENHTKTYEKALKTTTFQSIFKTLIESKEYKVQLSSNSISTEKSGLRGETTYYLTEVDSDKKGTKEAYDAFKKPETTKNNPNLKDSFAQIDISDNYSSSQGKEGLSDLAAASTLFHELWHVNLTIDINIEERFASGRGQHHLMALDENYFNSKKTFLEEYIGRELTETEQIYHKWSGLETTNAFLDKFATFDEKGNFIDYNKEGKEYYELKKKIDENTGLEIK